MAIAIGIYCYAGYECKGFLLIAADYFIIPAFKIISLFTPSLELFGVEEGVESGKKHDSKYGTFCISVVQYTLILLHTINA